MAVKKVPAKAPGACRLGAGCPYPKVKKLHSAYLEALSNLRDDPPKKGRQRNPFRMEERRRRLPKAMFVRDVAAHAAKADPDIWACFRHKDHPGKKATNWGTSALADDIRETREAFENLESQVEEAAKRLVGAIENEGFQQHLLDFHRHFDFEYTLYDAPDPLTMEETAWRHMDHCLAALTDQLSESKAGRTFLERTLELAPSSQGPALKDVWSYFKQARSVRGPLGKLVYNLSAVVSLKLSTLVRKQRITTVAHVLDNGQARALFAKLAAKIDVSEASLREAVATRADELGSKITANDLDDLAAIVDRFDEWDQHKFDLETQAAATLDDGWWSLAFEIISFAVANGPILATLDKATTKDLVSLGQGIASLAKAVSDQIEAKQILKEVDAPAASRYAQVFGATTVVLSLVLTLIEMEAALRSGDAKKILVAYVGAVAAVGGMVATLVSASVASGVFAIVGVAIAVVGGIMLAEHPIADYLRRTPWGTDWKYQKGQMTLDQVIDEYYAAVHELTIAMKIHPTEGDPMIVIKSNALSREIPVWVTVERPVDRTHKQRVLPGRSTVVGGKGKIERPGLDWAGFLPHKNPRTVWVRRPWEVWDTILRDDDTEHTLRATMDLDANGSHELTAKKTGVEFP